MCICEQFWTKDPFLFCKLRTGNQWIVLKVLRVQFNLHKFLIIWRKKEIFHLFLFKPLLFTWKSKWAEKYIYWTEYVTFQFLLQASCDDKILMWQPSLLWDLSRNKLGVKLSLAAIINLAVSPPSVSCLH